MEDQQQSNAVCSCELDSENSDTAASACPEGTCYVSAGTKDAATLVQDESWAATPEPVVDPPSDSAPNDASAHHLHQGSDDANLTASDSVEVDTRTLPESSSSAKSSPIRLASSPPLSSPKKTESAEIEAANCSSSKSDMDNDDGVESVEDGDNCSSSVTEVREGVVESVDVPQVSNAEAEGDDDNEEDEEEIICRLGEETSSMHSAIEELSSPSPARSKISESSEKSQGFEAPSPTKAGEDSDSVVTPESHEEFAPVVPPQNLPGSPVSADETTVPNVLSLSTVSDSVPSDSGVSGVTPTTEDVSTPGDTDTGMYENKMSLKCLQYFLFF